MIQEDSVDQKIEGAAPSFSHIIDDTNVKKLLLPRGKLSFRWNGNFIMNMAGRRIGYEKPKFKAKSLELHVVCKIPKESEMGQLQHYWYCWNCGCPIFRDLASIQRLTFLL
jgi:hypothetical protein